jgi:outer membrane murein-binding lipoprotein Lpp
MKNNSPVYYLATVASALVLLAGCAGSPTSSQLAKDQAKAEKIRLEAKAEQDEMKQEQLEEVVDAYPSWAINPPKADATGFYGVGIATDGDIRLSLQKSNLRAEFELAKQYRQVVSGSERNMERQTMDAEAVNQYTQLIDKLVAEVPVVGYDVVHREIKAIQGKTHTFVLLKMPYEEFNKAMLSMRGTVDQSTFDQAFSELERRVSEFRARQGGQGQVTAKLDVE